MDSTTAYVDVVLGTRAGFLAVAYGHDPYHDEHRRYKHRQWTERRYPWPGGREALHTDVSRLFAAGERTDVYVCPAVRFTDDRRKGSALPPMVCWADLDGPATDEALLCTLDPLVVQSGSAGHRHLYLPLVRAVDLGAHARLNRALAQALGADAKWSDEALLRLPGTLNHKTDPPTVVTPLPWSGRVWEPSELAALLGVDLAAAGAPTGRANAGNSTTAEPVPDPLPTLVRRALEHPDVADRSAAHHRVVGACYDARLTIGQALAVCSGYGPSVEKYGNRLAAEVDRSWRMVDNDRRARYQGTAPEESATGEEASAESTTPLFIDGVTFLDSVGEEDPPLWGDGDSSLWERGESLMLFGPPGVGKSTLAHLVVFGRLGITSEALGYPIEGDERKVLYLAMDRPKQIARAMRRLVIPEAREVLRERLMVHYGPLPVNILKATEWLLRRAQEVGAGTIVVDSVKDVLPKPSDEETANLYHRARGLCLAEGIEWAELHHNRKTSGGYTAPKSLDDVYGNRFLTAGAGSVISLFGESGDTVVEMSQVKTPSGEFYPKQVEIDKKAGTMAFFEEVTIEGVLTAAGLAGVLAREAAARLYAVKKPNRSQIQNTRNKLNRMVTRGDVERTPAKSGQPGEDDAIHYRWVPR